jgi:hypothetical protein
MQKPHYHHIVFSRNKAAIKAGLAITNCTLAEIELAKQLTFAAKKNASKIAEAQEFVRLMAAHADLVADPTGLTMVAALDKPLARANASIAGEYAAQAVIALDPVTTGVATPFLTATEFFEYNPEQKAAAELLYIAASNALFSVLLDTLSGNAAKVALTCHNQGFLTIISLKKQNCEMSSSYYSVKWEKARNFKLQPLKTHEYHCSDMLKCWK